MAGLGVAAHFGSKIETWLSFVALLACNGFSISTLRQMDEHIVPVIIKTLTGGNDSTKTEIAIFLGHIAFLLKTLVTATLDPQS